MHTQLRFMDQQRHRRGFSAVELLVAAAVLVLLLGAAVPMMRRYMRDGREEKAMADARMIAMSLQAFHDGLGIWPTRSSAGVDGVLWVLGSGAELPVVSPFLGANPIGAWLTDGEHGDLLQNHLGRNAPGGHAEGHYPIQGERRWRGPYGAMSLPLDPWDRPYVVVVRSGMTIHASRFQRMFVLSAGADGVLDTCADLTATTDIDECDIGVVVSNRR